MPATEDVNTVFFTIKTKIDLSVWAFLRTSARILKESTVAAVVEKKAVATGALRKRFRSTIDKSATTYTLSVYSDVPYAGFVDTGTRKHFPPVQSIADWVRAKRRSGGMTVEDSQIDRVAFLIARKMSRTGTKGRDIYSLALKKAVPQILDAADRILET